MSEPGNLFKVETKKRTAFNMRTKHSHAHYEIYYLLSGERYYFIDDRIYHVNQGDIIFIPSNVVHRTTAANNGEHERTVVYFQDQLLTDLAPELKKHPIIMNCFYRDSKVLRLKLVDQTTVENILTKLVAEAANSQPDSLLYQKALLIELLVIVNRLWPTEDDPSLDSLNPIHEKIHKIVRYICDNYATKITLTELSEQFYISQFYLSRMFKEVTGLTLIEYLNTVRIKEAQSLLQETDHSITEIAGLVGYDNQTYFGRMFKRNTGMTPRDYRKNSSQL